MSASPTASNPIQAEFLRLRRLLALQVAGYRAGMCDPGDVALIDPSTVPVSDQGAVSGADEAVAELAKNKPHLFRPAGASAGGLPASDNVNCLTMTDEQYAAFKASRANRSSPR
jgi:hypothetical protein